MGKANTETRQNLKSQQEANLILQNREARHGGPSDPLSVGENAWAALRAAQQKLPEIGFSLTMVRVSGFEPVSLQEQYTLSIFSFALL